MKIQFIPPTNRIVLVDGEVRREFPPTVTVWMWDPDNSDFLRLHGSDSSWINDMEVVYDTGKVEDRLNVYLSPINRSEGIQLDPYVRYPERVFLNKAEFKDVIQPGKNSGVWVMKSPVGLHFVKERNECVVHDMSNIVVVSDCDGQTSLTECNCDLDNWSIHDIVNTEKIILIYGVNTSNPVTCNVAKFVDVACSLIFGNKCAFSDEKKKVASMLIPILGDWYINRLDEINVDGIVTLIHATLTMGAPNGVGAASVMQNKETLVSLFEGIYARYYVSIKGDTVLCPCGCILDSNGCLNIIDRSGERLSTVAERYFGIKHNSKYENDLMAAASACMGV